MHIRYRFFSLITFSLYLGKEIKIHIEQSILHEPNNELFFEGILFETRNDIGFIIFFLCSPLSFLFVI